MATGGSQNPASVRIVVAGEAKTGKSSLILAAATGNFSPNVPSVLPPTKLTDADRIPFTIIDTSSSSDPNDRNKLVDELKTADAIVLTYACDRPKTLDKLISFWLPELRRLDVKVPVVVVGCMLDKRDDNSPMDLDQTMSPIMDQYREIETCMECSASRHIQVAEVFLYPLRSVLNPTAPLFDHQSQNLTPRCLRALKRIFILSDHDRDGSLSDAELNEFQVKCFNAPMQPSEIAGIKRSVQQNLPEGVSEDGLTLTGFFYLHGIFIQMERIETVWAVLKKFGYNNDLRLADDMLPPPIKRHPNQTSELTDEALNFLRKTFSLFDTDEDSSLAPLELEQLFSTAPQNPWNEAPYKDSGEKIEDALTLDGFLSQWTLMAVLDPVRCFEHLMYIGYSGDVSSAIRVTLKKQVSDRNVFQCFVFGPQGSGKSAVLDSLTGRPFLEEHDPTTDDRYSVHVVQQPGSSTKKTLVLREIPEDNIDVFLSDKHALAACDVAVFVHDRSEEASWKRATELLLEVADSGQGYYKFPCLIAAAKDDLEAYPTEIQDSTRVSHLLGIEAPIPISAKLGEFNDIFQRILSAAENPRMSVPETEAGRNRRRYKQLLSRSLMFASIGAAAFIGLRVYRIYAARKSSSG